MTAIREPISFIVPTYNSAGTVRQTVKSIFDGNFEAGDEIILIDDCSTDNTPGVLEKMQESQASIRVLKHNQNRGTGAAGRNTGIECATHDLLFCLDADNILAAESLTGLWRRMRTADADVAAFGELRFFRTRPDEVTHTWVFKESVSLSDALSGPVWPGPSGNYLFTRESWERAGRYHEPYLENRSVDSWTFGIRQLATGSKMVTLPGTWYFHRYGQQSQYVKNERRGNQSLAALIGLIPLLDVLDEQDVEYLFSRNGRYTWYAKLHEHPIRVKSRQEGKDGQIHYLEAFNRRSGLRGLKSALKKVALRVSGRRV
jgi:glycosyltransferase involved in cell wall biosynthesis